MGYRDDASVLLLRLEGERERALDTEERLGPGAFRRLPRGDGSRLQALREACDALDRETAPERALLGWREYQSELAAAFPSWQVSERALFEALRALHGVELRGQSTPMPQRHAATMVDYARRVDPKVRLAFDGSSFLGELPSLQAAVVGERRREGFRWTAGARVTRRTPRFHARPTRAWLRRKSLVAAPDVAYPRAFYEEGQPPLALGPDVRAALLLLDALDAAVTLDVEDGLVAVRWRHDARDAFEAALRIVQVFQRTHPAPTLPEAAPARKQRPYRRWPPPAR